MSIYWINMQERERSETARTGRWIFNAVRLQFSSFGGVLTGNIHFASSLPLFRRGRRKPGMNFISFIKHLNATTLTHAKAWMMSQTHLSWSELSRVAQIFQFNCCHGGCDANWAFKETLWKVLRSRKLRRVGQIGSLGSRVGFAVEKVGQGFLEHSKALRKLKRASHVGSQTSREGFSIEKPRKARKAFPSSHIFRATKRSVNSIIELNVCLW